MRFCSAPLCLALTLICSVPLDGQAPMRDPKISFINLATAEMKSAHFRRAMSVARDCLLHYPKEKHCLAIFESAKLSLTNEYTTLVKAIAPENLPGLENTLREELVFADSPAVRQALRDTQAKKFEIRNEAPAYIDSLHSGKEVKPLPDAIRRHASFMPELQVASQECDLPAFFGPLVTGKWRPSVRLAGCVLRIFLPGQREAA